MSTQKSSAAESRASFQVIAWQLDYIGEQLRSLSASVVALGGEHRTRAKSMRNAVASVAAKPLTPILPRRKRLGRPPGSKNGEPKKG